MSYRIGVVGFRRGGGPAHVFAALPDCQLAAVCELDPLLREHASEQFPGVATFSNYAEMLRQGLDVVLVATPVPMHVEHSTMALEAGCHVLQEVTLASSIAEARSLLDVVKAHPRQKFMLAENCNYWAHVMSWREMFRQGLLGEFMYAEAEYIHDVRSLLRTTDGRPTWRATLPPIHYCTHSLGPLLSITGERCTTASGLRVASKMDPDLGHTPIEVGVFQTASGGVIKVLCAFGIVREPAFHYYTLYGTEGTLETERPPEGQRSNAYLKSVPYLQNMIELPLGTDVPGAPAVASQGGHGTTEYYMIQDFMDCVRNDTKPPIDIHAALDMALPGLCAHESALQGGTAVPIPDWR